MTPAIGQVGGLPVGIDIGKLVETHTAVVANPGGGKSYTVRKILELAAGGPQRIVLDVEDEFYTLREATPSLLIAGGSNGDCPATVDNAAALARLLLETGADAVIQLNDLGLSGQRLFVARFLEAMVSAPTSLWHPALVVLDEVQRVAPEGAPAESSDAVVSLLMQGRKRGFGALIATQRLARVSKNVTGAVNNWFLGRAGQTIDRRAVCEMLGVTASSDEGRGLPKLFPGEFWTFGPAISVEPRLIKVEAAKTTHLRAGQRDVPTPPAPAQIRKMLAALKVQQQATPGTAGGAGAPSAAEITAAEGRGYDRGVAAGVRQERERFARTLQQCASDIQAAVSAAAVGLRALHEQLFTEAARGGGRLAPVPPPPAKPPVPRRPEAATPPEPETGDSGALRITPSLQRILDALAWLGAAGLDPASRAQLGLLAGYSPNGGGFANYLGALRAAGLISYPSGGEVSLTATGLAAAARPARDVTTADLHDRLRPLLGAARWSILERVISEYPASLSRGRLAADTNYAPGGGGFANYLGSLRTLGLISYPVRGTVRAEPILFIETPPKRRARA